jgi:hypothetical protein
MSRLGFRILWILVAAISLTSTMPLVAAVYTVGPDAACNFHTITDALAAAVASPGADRINIVQTASDGTTIYTAQAILINGQDLAIVGGYQNCSDPTAPTASTLISGAGNGGNPVIAIAGTSNVLLSNLKIGDGQHGAAKGGGISFDGSGTLTVASSSIVGNKAGYGAGVYMHESGGSLTVLINANSTIERNDALFDGGGIYAQSGALTLASSLVDDNTATRGGGIAIASTSGMTTIVASARINSNTATLGGGIWSTGAGQLRIQGPGTFLENNETYADGAAIYIEGGTRLFILDADVSLYANFALGNGGGLQIVGPARADIGSAVFLGNQAVNGGAISIDSSQNFGQAVLRLFSTDPTRPARITGNIALANGGGIYLKPSTTGHSIAGEATLCAHDFRVDTNRAIEGGAVYAGAGNSSVSGSAVLLERSSAQTASHGCDPEPTSALGAVPCFANASCNLIDGNQALDSSNNHATEGATLFGDSGSYLVANQQMFRANNSNGYIVRMNAGNAVLNNTLIADNYVTQELVLMSGTPLSVQNCTFANDIISATYAISSDGDLQISDSIFDEPFLERDLLFTGAATGLHVNSVMTNYLIDLPSDPSIVFGDPLFVDMANGDYRLTATKLGNTITVSPAIDFAAAAGGDDIANRPRDRDVASAPNRFGTRDLGAYEMQPITDRLFADGFGDPVPLVY